jgi:hypothetical protein
MKRMIAFLLAAVMFAAGLAFAAPTTAQSGGCKAFGQNIAMLATTLGPGFGANASDSAPLNDTVAAEQQALCG